MFRLNQPLTMKAATVIPGLILAVGFVLGVAITNGQAVWLKLVEGVLAIVIVALFTRDVRRAVQERDAGH